MSRKRPSCGVCHCHSYSERRFYQTYNNSFGRVPSVVVSLVCDDAATAQQRIIDICKSSITHTASDQVPELIPTSERSHQQTAQIGLATVRALQRYRLIICRHLKPPNRSSPLENDLIFSGNDTTTSVTVTTPWTCAFFHATLSLRLDSLFERKEYLQNFTGHDTKHSPRS